MGDVAYYYPPVYQRSPAGSDDSLTTGASGKPGTPGADGRTIINGSGAPTSTQGKPGDLYYQLDGTVLWGPKTDSGWGASGVSLVGKSGVDGSRIYRVSALPSSGDGYANGDILIDDQGNLAQVINS